MTAKHPKKRGTQPPRADDFKSVARRLGCDDDKATFEAKLKKIAKAKPSAPSQDNKQAWGKRGFKSK